MRVAAFTGGRHVPSARFRVRQLLPYLATCGVTVREFISPLGAYPPRRRWLRPLWLAASLASRAPQVAAGWSHDMSLLQREFVSTLVTLEPCTRRPRVLDVDDAIFLLRGGKAARGLATASALTICGNDYLAEHFSAWCPRVAVLPTAVDAERYHPRPAGSGAKPAQVLGWIGTSGNYGYLTPLAPALEAVWRHHPRARLRIVSDRPPPPELARMPQVDYQPWSAETEVALLHSFDIGLMPLADDGWTRGKCSFKMLQYMACGLPVVISPVGMNTQVLALGDCGLPAGDTDQWQRALLELLADPAAAQRMGQTGRHIVTCHFSLPVIAPQLAALLRSVA